jgi:hypothetical protein
LNEGNWPQEEPAVQDTSSKSREHRMRVLEHQARLAAERAAPPQAGTGAQRKIPMVAPVTGGTGTKAPTRPRRARHKLATKQLNFEGL